MVEPVQHILVYEPRVEGHHVGFLKFVTEDLLDAGFRLTLAIDLRKQSFHRTAAQLGGLLDQVALVQSPDLAAAGRLDLISGIFARSGADLVFLDTFDEIGSAMLRRAALGLMPPEVLKGRLGGIYHRPRFLARTGYAPRQWIKARGFARMLTRQWFSHLLFVDPYLQSELKTRWPQSPLFYLPDCYPENFAADRAAARRQFELPQHKRVFLFYGGGYRRKGLDLAVAAMRKLGASSPAFLLCAGQQNHHGRLAQDLAELCAAGAAAVVDRYVSADEEKQLFAASDVVLLPYRQHFGISGVLMRAVGAGLPVIASDEELLGRLVRTHRLGPVFPSGDVDALRDTMASVAEAGEDELETWRRAARAYAPQCSRGAFRAALQGAFRAAAGVGAET